MAYKVVLAEPAFEDIAQTVAFIAMDSTASARDWLTAIESAVETLQLLPLRAPLIPENQLFLHAYRHLIFKAHRIIFRVDDDTRTVFVVRVHHSSRGPLELSSLA